MEKEFDEVKPKLEEKKDKRKENKTESYFDGKFIEYIGYKLLAIIITVASLTIAKPWADKLILDYKINHTVYNGKRLKFVGKGSSLFVERLKWILLTIVTLGIYSLWIPIKMERWVTSNIHFEDEELKSGESYFYGKLLGLIGINIFTVLLTLVSFGLLFPFAICYKQKWIAKHTVINCKKIVFDGKALSLIGHYLLWYLLSIVTLGIYGLWLPMKVYGWQVKNTHIKVKDEEYEKQNIIPVIAVTILAILVIAVLITVIPKTNLGEILSGDKSIREIFKNNKRNNGNYSISHGTMAFSVTFENDGNLLTGSYKYGDEITDIEIPKKDGYKFIRWIDEDGNEVKSGYVVKGPVKITAIFEKIENKPNNSTNNNSNNSAKPTSKCNNGYVYMESDNMCYSLNEYVEPINISGGEGDYVYNGIGCADGYQISWEFELGFEGMCYKLAKPNY